VHESTIDTLSRYADALVDKLGETPAA